MTVVQPGRYRHYKGKEYTVLGIARHSETEEDLARNTEVAVCGCDRRTCSWRRLRSRDKLCLGFGTWGNDCRGFSAFLSSRPFCARGASFGKSIVSH